MNRVTCTAHDEKMKIYYIDADSIRIDEAAVLLPSKVYEEKCGRLLIGKHVHSHCDLGFKGMANVRCAGLVVWNQACCVDKLEGTCNDGSKQHSYKSERYIRRRNQSLNH